ncbi:DUF2851 family protein [Galbibacter mesophilus]|uniref:DUF2851 family protein n=1 Tax=Galbibacter mesophilus TaxID=379069 RepID=UPI00191E1241|nr:DUF2851 family protein [Galbibacter mesophilus]MCM5661625.1 DUF2851 family protein [Galbibacter mesophilus]
MKEDFLHYIWKFKKFNGVELATQSGDLIELVSLGNYNQHSGPDFLNAQLRIGGQLWAGSVEMHLKSSFWYAHHHQNDNAYNNVILHVVWEHDVEVFNAANAAIPTLELQNIVDEKTLYDYQNLVLRRKKFINCEKDLPQVDTFHKNRWFERLFFERLQQKSKFIESLLGDLKNDWEAVLFQMLLKNFGTKVNAASFASIGNQLPFGVFRKNTHSIKALEALLFGISNLLPQEGLDSYPKELSEEYHYLANKFKLSEVQIVPQFFKLRPYNFPTLRLSQLANLYHVQRQLFHQIISCNNLDDFYGLLQATASPYWNNHFTFQKEASSVRKKKISKNVVDLLLINTIIPLKFCYAKQQGKEIEEEILTLLRGLTAERNNIVDAFIEHGVEVASALESQSVLQMYHNYCAKNKCLQCEIGVQLMGR